MKENWVVAAWKAKEEKKLTRPENYKKKSLTQLRRSIRRIEENLALVSRGDWGPVGTALKILFRDHRKIALRELNRRGANGKAA
jgi:hypothetical protein